jgi:hypothetical protein
MKQLEIDNFALPGMLYGGTAETRFGAMQQKVSSRPRLLLS